MDGLRKILGLLLAIALTSLTLPATAGNDKKQFSVDMEIAPPGQTSAPFTLTATIKNEGNSTINSFRIVPTNLTVVGVNQPSTGNATFTGTSVSVQNMHPLKSGDSVTVTLRVSSCGDGTWVGSAWSGSSLNGASFDLVPGHSNLATSISCGSLVTGASLTVPDSLNPDCVTAQRGFYDKDGSIPVSSLPIFVTNTVPTNQVLHFRWPDFQTGGDPFATFEYTICASGPLPDPGITQDAWLNVDGSPASTPGVPAYVTAQNCLDPAVLPTPYGQLTATLGPAATIIPIDHTTPLVGLISYPGSAPVDPSTPGTRFDVVIGTERITVQLVCLDNDGDPNDAADCTETDEGEGTALAVIQRAVGGTTTPVTPQAAGALVMSTPLPLLPASATFPYVAGNQALMCIAERFESEDHLSHSTTFIDIGGDGFGKVP